MPNFDIRNFRTTDFDEDIQLEFQQRGAKLEGTYLEEPMNDFDATFNVMGRTEAQQSTTMFGDTPEPSALEDIVRVVVPTVWEDVAWIDRHEMERSMSADGKLQPKYAQNLAYGLGRRKDLIVMNAMVGPAINRTFNPATGLPEHTTVPYDDANQTMVHDNLPFNVDKLIDAVALLQEDEAHDGMIWCVITPHQRAQLMKDGEFTNFDFNSARPLMNNFLGSYYGVNFIWSSLLNNPMFPGLQSTTVDTALMWNQNAVGFKRQQGIESMVSLRDDKKYLIQIYASASGGFTRIQDKGVLKIESLIAA